MTWTLLSCGLAWPLWSESAEASVFVSPTNNPAPRTTTAGQRAADLLRLAESPTSEHVRELAAALTDDAVLVRQAAVAALTQCGSAAEAALPALTQALADNDARVRWGAAVTLGRIGLGAANAEAALAAAIRDRDQEVRCAALAALRSVPVSDFESLEPALLTNLSHDDADVRDECVATLAVLWKWCDADQLERLSLALAKTLADEQPRVRLAAATLLGDLGLSGAPAIPTLAGGVVDSDTASQAAMVRALEQFAEEVDRDWNSLNPSQRETLTTPCELAERLLADSESDSADAARIAERYRELLKGIQLARTEPVAKSLADSPAVVSKPPAQISQAIAHAAKPTANAGYWTVAMWLIFSMAVVGGVTWLSRLRAAKQSAPADFTATAPKIIPISSESSSSAEVDLIDMHVVPAVVASLPSASAPDIDEPVHAEVSPADAAERAALSLLLAGLRSPVPRERADAAYRLSSCGPLMTEALSALRRALLDGDAGVRCRAAFAVGQIGGAAEAAVAELALLIFDRVSNVRRHAVSALGGIGPSAVAALPELTRAVADPDAGVRRGAVTALGLIDPLAAESVLRQALADPDADVRECAQVALSSVTPNSASPEVPVITLKVVRPNDRQEPDQATRAANGAARPRITETLARAA